MFHFNDWFKKPEDDIQLKDVFWRDGVLFGTVEIHITENRYLIVTVSKRDSDRHWYVSDGLGTSGSVKARSLARAIEAVRKLNA